MKDIVIGIPTKECSLLNHSFNNPWETTSVGMPKEKRTFKYSRFWEKVKLKYETEKCICTKNKKKIEYFIRNGTFISVNDC